MPDVINYTNKVIDCNACGDDVIDTAVGWDNHRCEILATHVAPIEGELKPPSRLEVVANIISVWQQALNLGSWTLRIGEGFASKEEDAYVVKERRERVATIFIDPKADATQTTRLVVHELLHLSFDSLEFLAQNGRASTTIMDLVEVELERVINDMTTALTGVLWEPINKGVRKNHEFDDLAPIPLSFQSLEDDPRFKVMKTPA